MGLLNIFTGRSSVKPPASRERLFALSTAYVTLETSYEIVSAGVAGIAALHRNLHLIAGFYGFAGSLQGRQRQNALALETDVEEDRVTGDNNHRAHELFAAIFSFTRMALLVLRKQVAE